MSLKDDLLAKAEAYCAAHKLTLAALGDLIMRDNKFFGDVLANRRGFTMRTYDRVTDALQKSPEELRRLANPSEVA